MASSSLVHELAEELENDGAGLFFVVFLCRLLMLFVYVVVFGYLFLLVILLL